MLLFLSALPVLALNVPLECIRKPSHPVADPYLIRESIDEPCRPEQAIKYPLGVLGPRVSCGLVSTTIQDDDALLLFGDIGIAAAEKSCPKAMFHHQLLMIGKRNCVTREIEGAEADFHPGARQELGGRPSVVHGTTQFDSRLGGTDSISNFRPSLKPGMRSDVALSTTF
jgi:hypothetical protein